MESGPEFRAEYERRLHRVFSHIDDHLDQALDLAQLAQVAHFSAFHFHRVFAAHTGETLGNYVTRRRVEIAAARLAAQPRLTVLEIAIAVGFGSAEAFARAFKKRFGCTPSEWKRDPRLLGLDGSKLSQTDRKGDQANGSAGEYAARMNSSAAKSLSVTIQSRPEVRVAYLRYQGPFGESVGRFWAEEVCPWMAEHALFDAPRYGISHDDPAVTVAAQCRYDAAVEVSKTFQPVGKAKVTTIPAGKYAGMRFSGTSAEVPLGWHRLLREWLPASGYQLDARPCFEHYTRDDTMDEKTGAFTCTLCIPIAPL